MEILNNGFRRMYIPIANEDARLRVGAGRRASPRWATTGGCPYGTSRILKWV